VVGAKLLKIRDRELRDLEGQKDAQSKGKQRQKIYYCGAKLDTLVNRVTGKGLVKWKSSRGPGLPFGQTATELARAENEAREQRQLRKRLRGKRVPAWEAPPAHLPPPAASGLQGGQTSFPRSGLQGGQAAASSSSSGMRGGHASASSASGSQGGQASSSCGTGLPSGQHRFLLVRLPKSSGTGLQGAQASSSSGTSLLGDQASFPQFH
jgi:hypothetical protein